VLAGWTRYDEGFEAAMQMVEEWDKYVAHPYRLSDAIRMKVGRLEKSKVRKNSDCVVQYRDSAPQFDEKDLNNLLDAIAYSEAKQPSLAISSLARVKRKLTKALNTLEKLGIIHA